MKMTIKVLALTIFCFFLLWPIGGYVAGTLSPSGWDEVGRSLHAAFAIWLGTTLAIFTE